jgi:hypothetical protein
MQPVKPAPSFKEQLAGRLQDLAARRGEADIVLARTGSSADVLVGAATVALAGGILYFARSYLVGRSESASRLTR